MTESPLRNILEMNLSLFTCLAFFFPLPVFEDQDDGVTPEEHLGDEPVLVHRLGLLLPFASFWQLCPHLLHPLKNHVAMPIKSFDPSQELLVIPAVDENLGVVFHRVCEDPERPS